LKFEVLKIRRARKRVDKIFKCGYTWVCMDWCRFF